MKTNTYPGRNSLKSMIAVFALLTFFVGNQAFAQQYCSSSGSKSKLSFIDRVEIDAMSNQSGNNGGYADFTSMSVNVTAGNTYNVSLTPKNRWPFSWWTKNYWRIWVDYNNDGDFTDQGELVLQENGRGTINALLTAPAGITGSKRVRISQSVWGYQNSCAHFKYGEVEDYRLHIDPAGPCLADAGSLTADADTACAAAGAVMISATPDGNSVVPAGYSTVYVLTSGAGLVIEQAGPNPSFTVNGGGLYTIHTLVYDPNTLDLNIVVPGVTTGVDVNNLLIQGGGTICASLDVAGAPVIIEKPRAGSISADASSVCFTNGSATFSATPDGNIHVPPGYNSLNVLTSGAGLVIEQVDTVPEFTVSNPGLYTIHTLVYDPNTLNLGIVVPGTTTGVDVFNLIVPGGGSICASLDVAGAPVVVAHPDAGSLTADADTVCAAGGPVTVSATPDGNDNVPQGFSTIYVLTSGSGLVIEQADTVPSFTVTEGGNYTIHTLVYDPNTLNLGIVVPGVTTGFDVNNLLVQGGGHICASLDVPGAPVTVEDPNAGTLTADASSVCFSMGSATISATPDGNIHVPAGYNSLYVLTSGAGLVIEQVDTVPSFTVTSPGLYTIHTLVYNPNTLNLGIVVPGTTTGVDVFGLIVPGGGNICASLDVAGAPVVVAHPDAGTITADADTTCAAGGPVTISATPDGNANVPMGYSTVYVLTSGSGLVIEQADTVPSFTVTEGGSYTIHTLVYDPATLNLGIVVPGTTTGFDVNNLLVQGGGSICASLDVAGAPVVVENPNAGTLTADATSACLVNGSATISATPDGNIHVPAGYTSLFVLTSGTGLVIEQVDTVPQFTVTSTGLYTIHTLVYNPNTLNLGIVVPGTTTGVDVFGLIVPGGGSICASLDVAGAPVVVADPDAGTITAVADTVCGVAGSAAISATPDGNAVVPAGFQTVYVLTKGSGLVIEQAGPNPSFTVSQGGSYTIHTLVYDPNTLNLGIVVPGTTTGFDVNNLLIQGGGTICASLDVPGAPVYVEMPYAGTLHADNFINCLNNSSSTISASAGNAPNVPAGYSVVYVLTKGNGLVIEQAGPNPSFTVTSTGLYRIHTLVYNPNTLDLGIVVPGTTTGFDVNNLLVQGGGSICASLDVQGAPALVFHSWICDWFFSHRPNTAYFQSIPADQAYNEIIDNYEQSRLTNAYTNEINVYPNPANEFLNIDLSEIESENVQIRITNSIGQDVYSDRFNGALPNLLNVNVSEMPAGLYFVQVQKGNDLIIEKIQVK